MPPHFPTPRLASPDMRWELDPFGTQRLDAEIATDIPGEHLRHFFDRFSRVDQARTDGSGRSSLGLAIAITIAEQHSGATRARFIVSLPVSARDAKPRRYRKSNPRQE